MVKNYFFLQPPKSNEKPSCKCTNQRKLTKQVALEPTPPIFESDNFTCQLRECERKNKSKELMRMQCDKIRKSSVSTSSRTILSTNRQESWYVFLNKIFYTISFIKSVYSSSL